MEQIGMATKLESNDFEAISYENIIHDIKTPLSIIYSKLTELENIEAMPVIAMETLNEIKKHWFKILKLITDANDSVKIKNDALSPKLRNYNIVELVNDIVSSAKTLADKKSISVLFESDVQNIEMATDKDMLERILLNLLSNSIKFTASGGSVTISIKDSENGVRISVKDTGIGIHIDDIGNIYDRYYRGKNEYHMTGSGLGLAIVKQLTMLLGGAISIKRLEVGTEILIDLPVNILKEIPVQLKLVDDFYTENIVQIELTD